MSKEKEKSLLLIGLALAGLFFLLFRSWAGLFLLVLSTVGMFAGLYYLAKYIRVQRDARIYGESIEGIIDKRLQQCNHQIEKNHKEIKEIRNHIRELEFRLNQTFEIDQDTQKETYSVIEGFKKELALRETKVSFYQACKKKFSTLLYNYTLHKDLIRKKEKLSKLQEENYESVAQMEMMKSDIEYDISYIEVISDLSSRMMNSTSLDSAKALQLQLAEISDELRRL